MVGEKTAGPTRGKPGLALDGYAIPSEIFDEEYNVWFLDWGGALVAMKHTPLPVRHL
ncbi:hypothetical protein STEG23_026872, partial [Scotinomys teguina]